MKNPPRQSSYCEQYTILIDDHPRLYSQLPINFGNPVFISQEMPIGIISNLMTSANQLEINQQISELSSLLNHLPGIVYRCKNDSHWTMEYISEGCWQLTGYEVKDLLFNHDISYSDLIHPEDQSYVRLETQNAVATHTDYHLEYRIYTAQQEEKWVWQKGKGVYSDKGELLCLEGLIIDVTEKKKIEQEKFLLLNITQAITSAPDFETALLFTLEKVCNTTGWDFGEAWLPNKENNYLTYSTAWFSADKNQLKYNTLSLAEFKLFSYDFTFSSSLGLPGKVWATKQPFWLEDVSLETMFLRNQLAEKCGLKAGFGVPITANEEVVAVLVFFLRQSLSQDDGLLILVENIACQLGSVFKHKQLELQLRDSQRQLATLVDSTSGAFFRISYDINWAEDYISDTCLGLTGYTSEQLLDDNSLNLASITHPLDLEKVVFTIQQNISKHRSYNVEYRIFTSNNQEKWLWEKGQGVYDEDDNLLGIEGFITDISDRKQMESALIEAKNKYQNMFENAIEGIFQTTINGYYLSANKSLAKIYGYNSPEELKIKLNDIENSLYVNPHRRQQFIQLIAQNDLITEFESQVYRKDGSIIWISENARAVRDLHGNLLYYEGTVEDITQRKEIQEKLHHQAFYDGLTKLPNRTLFLQKLGDAIQKRKQDNSGKTTYTESTEFGLLFLDCDRFKAVNDSLGHGMGDLLLIEIAQRLTSCINENEIVARLGGDEFTILCLGVTEIKQLIQLAEKIHQIFQPPFAIKQNQLFCGVSIGILFSSSLTEEEIKNLTPAKALQFADTALYQAKNNSKGFYQIFQAEMHNQALVELQLETELRQALQQEELKIYYQPIVNLITEKISGFECLIRWQHPEKGLITPFHFIPTAEKTGLIIPIGFWILKQSCSQLAKWHQKLLENNPQIEFLPSISVNLSCREFEDENFINYLEQILAETQVNPSYLKLEVTESCCIFQNDFASGLLAEIKRRKIQIWIDDFGTGYSSFSYLHKLPIDGLKLDRSFIIDLEENPVKMKIIKAIFTLAKDLGLDVIAEGIETKIHLEKLKEIGCELGQGYYFSKPIISQKAEKLLLIRD